MSERTDRTDAEARQEIQKLREENSELEESMLVYTGLAGQMHRQHGRMEQLKTLLSRAADALEKSPDGAHSQLVQELRKAAE